MASACPRHTSPQRVTRARATLRLLNTSDFVPQAAFYWETPPTTLATAAATPFTFVTKAAHTLARAEPDAGPFAAQLKECAGLAEARSFGNLGGDATLVSPCAMQGESAAYAHLGKFVRRAPAAQQAAFWTMVGQTISQTLAARGDAPTWVSTDGLTTSSQP